MEGDGGIELYDLLEVCVAEDGRVSFFRRDVLMAELVHEPSPIYYIVSW